MSIEPDYTHDGQAYWDSVMSVSADGTGNPQGQFPPCVRVSTGYESDTLTPTEARRLAQTLVAAADWAEGSDA